MKEPIGPSRRSFLRRAAASVLLSPAFGTAISPAQGAKAVEEGAEISVLSRIELDRELYEHEAILHGTLYFRHQPRTPIRIQWIDNYGRIAGESTVAVVASLAKPVTFSFQLRTGLTCMNSIRVLVNGVAQAVTSRFMRSSVPSPWDDYQVISWANYPNGYYDQLRAAGVNATIAYREGDFSQLLDNDFSFYVEQMAWEVYSIYHKDLPMWRDLIAKVRTDRSNLDHWVRRPCLNDPATQKYVSDRLQRYVREHRPFQPLYYNIADELGQGDQLSANDFCHSTHCALAFSNYQRASYGTLVALRNEWALSEIIRWDDEGLLSNNDWEKSNLLIDRTTTDAAFESIALANLVQTYGSVQRFNKEWGTTFPEPGGGMGPRECWEPVLGAVRETISLTDLSDASLEKGIGPLQEFNARCGKRAGWNAPQTPGNFKTWSEVRSFLNRYYKELGEVSSVKGWNASPWSDFRNFMDSTFADAVLRAATVCKTEDPRARCATEGGQAPFAFGWYNYEQVLRAVDVIEPYNIGNNVEVVRSLKPQVIMLSTYSYEHKLGTPLTENDLLQRRQAVRNVWWNLFHSHRGNIVWDDLEDGLAFVDLKTGQLTPSAETFFSVFHELRNGIGMLIMNSERTRDEIAIHYSHPSVQAHWLLENVKKAREWMVNTVDAPTDSRFIAVRNSWTKLIEDLHFQYDFVSATQVAAGVLPQGRFRVLILPESIAIGPAEADEIREFVRAGGTVVADSRAALLNQRCRDMGEGQLNDVFGIAQGSAQTAGSSVVGVANQGSIRLEDTLLDHTWFAENTLVTTTGKALAHCAKIPMVVVNQFGKGNAIYLNMDVSGYAFDRLNPKASSTLPDLIGGVLNLAEVHPRIRLATSDGTRAPGVEVVIYRNGACEIVAIFRNPQLDDGGWGSYAHKKENWRDWTSDADNSALEKEVAITIDWGTSMATYDLRGQKDLGMASSTAAVLSPWEPLVYTRAKSALPTLAIQLPGRVVAGSELEIQLGSNGPHPEGTTRVVHLDLLKPSGEIYNLYSRNLMVTTQNSTFSIPLALNDPAGNWTVKVFDLMTGTSVQQAFLLTEA